MWVLSAVWDLAKGTYLSLLELKKDARLSAHRYTVECDYYTDEGVLETVAVLSNDGNFASPRSINQLIRIRGGNARLYPVLNREGAVKMVAYCKNTDAVDFGKKPKKLPKEMRDALLARNEEFKKLAEKANEPEEKQRALNSISFADYEIPGAGQLSSYAEMVTKNIGMSWSEPVSKGKVLLLVIIGFLVGFIFAFIMSVIIFMGIASSMAG